MSQYDEKWKKDVFRMLNFINEFDFAVVEGKRDKEALKRLGVVNIKTSYEYFHYKNKSKKEQRIAFIFDLDRGGEKIKQKAFDYAFENNFVPYDASKLLSLLKCKHCEEAYKSFLRGVENG